MARRIKHAFVKRLALCKEGKNGLTTLYKSDGTAEFATLTKSDVDKGELLAVMWSKGLQDIEGDFVDTDAAIESMTSSLIMNGGALDIEHEGEPLKPEQARITEVFTIQPTDERFQDWRDYEGNAVDVTGGAAVKIQIDDPALRRAHREGLFDGVSLFGPAAVEEVDLKAASKRVAARMGGVQEKEMTAEELQAVLASQDAKVATLVKSAVAEAVAELKAQGGDEGDEGKDKEGDDKDKGDAEAKAPEFSGDPSNAEDLAAYGKELKAFELKKAIASGDLSADKILELSKSMGETAPSVAELNASGIPAEEGESDDVRKLQVQLFKARKDSNAPDSQPRNATYEDELAKANANEAVELAKVMNEMMGGSPDSSGMRIVSA